MVFYRRTKTFAGNNQDNIKNFEKESVHQKPIQKVKDNNQDCPLKSRQMDTLDLKGFAS